MNTVSAAPSVTSKVIAPQEAAAMLTTYKYEHQRKLTKNWVTFLAEEMRLGTFDQSTTIRVARMNGNGYLIDGQHRLMAVVESGLPQRFVVVENKESDLDEIAYLYTRIDQQRRRTVSEKFRTLALAEEWGLTTTQVDNLGTAVMFINQQWSKKRKDIHQGEHVNLMADYVDSYHEFIDVSKSSNGITSAMKHALKRAATVSVALVTYRYSQETYGDKVNEFWYGAIQDDGIANGDPRKVANRHLNEAGMLGGSFAWRQSKVLVTPDVSARYLAKCFNAYIVGEQKQFVRVDNPNAPILILGSPFNGK